MGRSRRASAPVLACLLPLACGSGPEPGSSRRSDAPAWIGDDFAWVRGANYVPSYAANDVVLWRDFDPQVVDRELGYAARAGLNSVRVFLQVIVYEHDPEGFLANLERFLALCEEHGMSAMPILFDSCFGTEPSLSSERGWVASPGFSRLVPEHRAALDRYLVDVVGSHRDDPRVLLWDVMNEPEAAPRTDQGRRIIEDFLVWASGRVRALDRSHPITIGAAGGAPSVRAWAHLQDVLSLHCYKRREELFRRKLAAAVDLSRETGKPLLVTECGNPGNGQDYGMVLSALREAGVGFYVWELMIGASPFAESCGFFYPDGTIRRRAHVAALLGIPQEQLSGFEVKPDAQGVPLVTRESRRSRATARPGS